MQSDAARSAFTLAVVHQRRDQRRITAVALLKAGQRVFLGLDNGVVEEHRCSNSSSSSTYAAVLGPTGPISAPVLRLQAEKKVFSRQAVADISPADAAARLVCLSEEGQVALVSLETFAVVPLPAARGAVAVCARAASHLPVLLGVATKTGKGRSKVAIFSVLPGATTTGSSKEPAVLAFQAHVPEAVTGLAWAGSSLLCAVPGGYYVLRPTGHSTAQHGLASPTAAAAAGTAGGMQYQLTLLADHLTSIRPLLGSIPDLGLGLMAWEDNMVLVTDAAGAAVREPLQLPLPPLALSSAGLFVVAVCDDGVYAFDRNSSRQVQQIEYAHDDAYVGLSQRLPAAADAGGRCICLATSSQVLWLEPVALEQQVRELLKHKRFDQALDLITSSTTDPHSQPSTPGTSTPPSSSHRPSTPTPAAFDSPAAAAAAAVAAAAAAAASRGGPSWQQVALAQAGLLMLLEAEFETGLSVLQELPMEVWQPCQLFSLFPDLTGRWLPKVPFRSYWGLHGQRLPEINSLIHDTWELRLATAPRQQQQQPLPTALTPAELQGLAQQAKTLVATCLTHVRQRQGLLHADGVDTLLLQLLCEVGDAAAVEALLSGQHAASAAVVEPALRQAGRWHGLALLQLHAGEHQAALDTWKAVASGDLKESPSSTGAVAEAGGNAAAVAVAAAAAAMAADGAHRVPVQVLLGGRGLQWLLERDAAASLVVLEARQDLPADVVLQLLEGCDTDLQWQYLYHQVYHNSSTQQQLHTQLAQVMITAIAKYLPSSSTHVPTSTAATAAAAGDGQHPRQQQQQDGQQQLTHAQLAAMAQQLPLLFAPNLVSAAHSTSSNQLDQMPSLQGGVLQRGSSILFSSAAGQVTKHTPAASRRQSSSFYSGFGASSSSSAAAMPPASMLAAGVSQRQSLHHPSHHQQQQHLQTVQEQTAHRHQQQQQQQHYPPGFGALAGQPVQPRQWLQQQQQGFSAAFSMLSLTGASAGRDPQQQGTRGADAVPSVSAAAQQQQQQQQQGTTQQQALSRQVSNIAGLLLQQQQHQQQSSRPAATHQQQQQQKQRASLAGGAPTSTSGQPPTGIRVLPSGLGPWPKPLTAAPTSADGYISRASSGQVEDTQHSMQAAASGAEGVFDTPFAAVAATSAVVDKVLQLRCLLVYHLQASLLYDAEVLLSSACALPLYPELALMHSRAGNHVAALLLLALLPPRLVEGAISYCRALSDQDAWLSLLELFLNPKAALSQSPIPLELYPATAAELAHVNPDYSSACRVLNAEGASLNPLQLLGALPAGMPLPLAGNVLARLLSGLQHRHRQGKVVRHLQRSRQLAAHVELMERQAGRVLLTDDSSCHGCGRLIGGKVFVVLPSGVVMCSRCSGAVGTLAAVAAADATP